MYHDVAVIIPARLNSTRLLNKALIEIEGKPMIQHVIERVLDSGILDIYIATDSSLIAEIANKSDAKAIMTNPDCPSGTDRVYEAFQCIKNSDNINYIINVQGDMPFIDVNSIINIVKELKQGRFDIVTEVVKVDKKIAESEANVKVVVDKNNKALYFSRSLIPFGAKEFLYHVGIYGFKKTALKKYVNFEQTIYEKHEKLEQLRALENGMTIGVCYSNAVPISVDTELDLAKARKYAKNMHKYIKK